jgi:hypothetical protein
MIAAATDGGRIIDRTRKDGGAALSLRPWLTPDWRAAVAARSRVRVSEARAG